MYYISLCLFFVVGAFATAFTNGQNVESLPDTSWRTPENFVAYVNSYLNEKVNPSTLADVLVTQYIDHPLEATNLMPLYPTQSIIEEYFLSNCSITELETYLRPGEEDTGTIVGIGFFTESKMGIKWSLESYQIINTRNYTNINANGSIKVVIETPRLIFNEEGQNIRIVITNFGNEYSDVVYIPTLSRTKDDIEFYGVNTIVDRDERLYLTLMNRYRRTYGARYTVQYDKYEGIEFHKQIIKTTSEGELLLNSDLIIGLFEYPSLIRKDSILNPYLKFDTATQILFPSLDSKFVRHVNSLLKSIPVVSSFFTYKQDRPTLTYSTMNELTKTDIISFSDLLLMQSQNNLEQIAQPVIRTLKISEGTDEPNDILKSIEQKRENLEYFNRTFIRDYNEFETTVEYKLIEHDFTTFELIKEGQRKNRWVFDLTKPVNKMVTEVNPLDDILLGDMIDGEEVDFKSLLNALNEQYYSPNEKGTTGHNEIEGRKNVLIQPNYYSTESFNHLVKLVQGIGRPDYNNMTIESTPNEGSYIAYDKEGHIIQKYCMFDKSEYLGLTRSLVSSQETRVNMWLEKVLGPWANLQIPDTRPVSSWVEHLYAMEDEKDENEYWSPILNNSRPFALSEVGVGNTVKGWYVGDRTYNPDYESVTDWEDVDDMDWDTPGVTWTTGAEYYDSTVDLIVDGGSTPYWQNDPYGYGHFMDNNGWLMLDLGEDLPRTTHWHASFDVYKATEANPQGETGYDSGDRIHATGGAEWVEAGLGIYFTDDIGILELMERYGTYSDDIGLMVPLHIGDGQNPGDGYTVLSVYDPHFITSFIDYDLFYNNILDEGSQLWHWAGGTLWEDGGVNPLSRYFHEMTYTHRGTSDRGILQLDIDRWYRVDVYYDRVSNLLNVLIDGVPVMTNLFMPQIDSSANLENVWFYNYGGDDTYISNLVVTDSVPPIPTSLLRCQLTKKADPIFRQRSHRFLNRGVSDLCSTEFAKPCFFGKFSSTVLA